MKIEVVQQFQRPLDKVLESTCDPQRFKRLMSEHGADAQVTKGSPNPQWNCAVLWRNAPREFSAELDQARTPGELVFTFKSSLSNATMVMQFEALEPRKTRVRTRVDLAPKSMVVRVAVQSLRLMRGNAEGRVRRFVHALGRA